MGRQLGYSCVSLHQREVNVTSPNYAATSKEYLNRLTTLIQMLKIIRKKGNISVTQLVHNNIDIYGQVCNISEVGDGEFEDADGRTEITRTPAPSSSPVNGVCGCSSFSGGVRLRNSSTGKVRDLYGDS